jgi:hypothetical protein
MRKGDEQQEQGVHVGEPLHPQADAEELFRAVDAQTCSGVATRISPRLDEHPALRKARLVAERILRSADGPERLCRRIGDVSQLSSVRPDPMLASRIGTESPSKWDSLTVIPQVASTSTTFTIAFRRPLTGAQRYVFRFTGPIRRTGCYLPVNQPIMRGPNLGIPSTSRGQIASTQFSYRTWCTGSYTVSVALAGRASQPFSTARFTVHL